MIQALTELPPTHVVTDVKRGISPKETEKNEISRALESASTFLELNQAAAKITKSKDAAPIERNAKLASAKAQHHIAQFILSSYFASDASTQLESRKQITNRVDEFWSGFQVLAEAPFKKAGLPVNSPVVQNRIRNQIEIYKMGIKGAVAAAVLAKESGWSYSFPTPEEDVDNERDLIIEKDGKKYALQIKCGLDIRALEVSFDINITSNAISVKIPGNQDKQQFYIDNEIGVPHKSMAGVFSEQLNKVIKDAKIRNFQLQ